MDGWTRKGGLPCILRHALPSNLPTRHSTQNSLPKAATTIFPTLLLLEIDYTF
ncbi:hypothetical protein BDP27DRAFT_1265890 [Rhodocollybia butyracea]|uniref:Uncharacterized protein n=1 Tax=Rhodocollybia butyracea TaxID=206335 RepID=A0A9P5PT04_9AGAR|nr:hypothetical protein BDP27DRAFT_1265890 [Rhodocollybia butyracea]